MCLHRSNGLLACFLSFTLYFCSSPSFAEGGGQGSQKDSKGEQSSQLSSCHDAPPGYAEVCSPTSPPPPYNEVAGGENESVIEVGAHTYKVTYCGDVRYMTQSSSLNSQTYEIVCDQKVQNLPIGHYVRAKAHHSRRCDKDCTQEFSGEIWLFPNGVDSPGLEGRVLILPHKYHLQANVKNVQSGRSDRDRAGIQARWGAGILSLRNKTRYPHMIYLSQVSNITGHLTARWMATDYKAQQFVDFGESRQQGEFVDESGQITYRVTVTQIYETMDALEQGTLIKIKIPNERFHHFHGREPWNSSGSNPPVSSVFEIGNQVLQFRFLADTKKVKPYITLLTDYSSMRLVACSYGYRLDLPTDPASEARELQLERQVAKEGGRAFYNFLRDHTISIYWEPPQGGRRCLGRYGGYKVAFFRQSVVDTLSLSKKSDLSYEEFFHLLGEDDAVFSIEVIPNYAAKLSGKMISKEPVQDDLPAMVRSFKKISLNFRPAKL